jgi:SAM-dependent methyltransferase
MKNILIKLFGWRAAILHGDPCAFARWIWLRKNLTPGHFRTLDAGCGSGAFTFYAAKIGRRKKGAIFLEQYAIIYYM